jgi:MoxR-like ATPase
VAQSKHPVLLEGETCSGKTALVVELARLAQRRLVVVSLSAETGRH